jgi:signal peptidase I
MLGYARWIWKGWGLKAARGVRRLRRLAAGSLCAAGVVGLSPWRSGVVIGHSMEPTLPHGAFFLYDQAYYRSHPVRAGEIVVVRHGDEVWIKRVYATEQAGFWTLRYGGNELIRHDPIRPTQEGYFAHASHRLRTAHGCDYRLVRLRVPSGCVFLVGDGVSSEDSRLFGPIGADGILGRVIPLPGQRLGTAPDWVELSSPRGESAVKASLRAETNSSSVDSG